MLFKYGLPFCPTNLPSLWQESWKLCRATVKSLFTNEGKHGGEVTEVTVDAVPLIAAHVKANDCQLHPDFVEVLMSLSFDEDLRKHEVPERDNKVKNTRGCR